MDALAGVRQRFTALEQVLDEKVASPAGRCGE